MNYIHSQWNVLEFILLLGGLKWLEHSRPQSRWSSRPAHWVCWWPSAVLLHPVSRKTFPPRCIPPPLQFENLDTQKIRRLLKPICPTFLSLSVFISKQSYNQNHDSECDPKEVTWCENSLSRELRLRTWLIQLLWPGPASLFSSWWMATIAFFLKPGRQTRETDEN